MKIIWLGHSSFRIEIEDQVLVIDPWFGANPSFQGHERATAINGATHVLVSHAHNDHLTDAPDVAKELNIPMVGIYDLMQFIGAREGVQTIGFNKGGTVSLGTVKVTMVAASHSSSVAGPNGPIYGGTESGFMIAGEGKTIYFSGDTDVMADMAVFEALHHPDIGILSIGGHFTMDQHRAAYAAKTFFNFKTIIPCHYRTFPLLEQDAKAMAAALPQVDVIEPEVMQAIEL